LESYRFAEAYDELYHFVWGDLADWYIEASKAQPNGELLAFVLEAVLKLAHPFAPFVTETIWQTLAWAPDSMLATSDWPKIPDADEKRSQAFEALQSIVAETRAICKALRVQHAELQYEASPLLAANAELVKRLAHLQAVTEGTQGKGGIVLTQTTHHVWLDIDPQTAKAHASKLAEQQKEEQAVIDRLESRLANAHYVQQAPEAVVEQTRAQLAEARTRLDTIKQEAQRFQA